MHSCTHAAMDIRSRGLQCTVIKIYGLWRAPLGRAFAATR